MASLTINGTASGSNPTITMDDDNDFEVSGSGVSSTTTFESLTMTGASFTASGPASGSATRKQTFQCVQSAGQQNANVVVLGNLTVKIKNPDQTFIVACTIAQS